MTTTSARVVMGAVGAALIAAVLTSRSALLVRPWFVPVLLVTGVVVIGAAVRVPRSMSPGAAALLLLPAILGAALSPALVGRVSQGPVDTKSIAARLGDAANPLLEGRGGRISLLQIAVAESKLGGVALAGRAVEVEAIVTGKDRISRSVMVCCAADARRVDLRVIGVTLPLKDSWVRVDGQLTTVGRDLVLDAGKSTAIRPPQQPFL